VSQSFLKDGLKPSLGPLVDETVTYCFCLTFKSYVASAFVFVFCLKSNMH